MEKISVLLVEDEPRLAEYTKKGLEENGFEVSIGYDGLIGKRLVETNAYDLLVFDVNIPKINGFELAQLLRQEGVKTPILLLTAMGTMQDKLKGFDNGADDYLVKPFDFQELIARLRSLHRRANEVIIRKKNLKVGPLELDLNEKIARRDGKEINLTSREYTLLEFLMVNQGSVISRVEIAEKVWKLNFDTGTNTIDVYVNFLRKKIDQNYDVKLIHTVVGMGYIMKA